MQTELAKNKWIRIHFYFLFQSISNIKGDSVLLWYSILTSFFRGNVLSHKWIETLDSTPSHLLSFASSFLPSQHCSLSSSWAFLVSGFRVALEFWIPVYYWVFFFLFLQFFWIRFFDYCWALSSSHSLVFMEFESSTIVMLVLNHCFQFLLWVCCLCLVFWIPLHIQVVLSNSHWS